MRAFIDSNIFVYAAQAHPEFGQKCRKIIEDVEKDKLLGVTTSLNISEVVEAIDRVAGRNKSFATLELLLALPIHIEPVYKEHLIMAKEYFNQYKINYFDCVYLAVMEEKFIKTIITNDAHFQEVDKINVIKPLEY
ncbi:MAG: type II toxin-antitoxin system VapC family toxin [Candidatus Hydrothermarchaeota archaeon]